MKKTILFTTAFLAITFYSFGQNNNTVPSGTDGMELTIPHHDSLTGKADNLQPNEVEAPFSTFKVGLGYIGDYAAFSQSADFKRQMDSANIDVTSKFNTRDARILASGLLRTKRELSWKFAFMYNGDTKDWLIRESGITIGVPEIHGRIFVGRTKEGFSLAKVMNGHSMWGVERAMAIDVIPILGDGIKYFGYFPKQKIILNVGYYNDFLSKGQSFSTFAWQYIVRVGFLPIYNKEDNKVLHIALNYQNGQPVDNKFNMKSRPESNIAPHLISTGSFETNKADIIGGEIYYSHGGFLAGTEVALSKFYSPTGDHNFFGGSATIAYLINGTRPYKPDAGIFGFTQTKNKSVFKGGWGTWEGVLMFSQFSLDDGNLQGGKLWRITPMVNWYMSKRLKLEFIYGYCQLDRFNLTGELQIFQTRIQVSMM